MHVIQQKQEQSEQQLQPQQDQQQQKLPIVSSENNQLRPQYS